MSEVGLAESADESKGHAFLSLWFLTLCLASGLIWFPSSATEGSGGFLQWFPSQHLHCAHERVSPEAVYENLESATLL